VGTGIGKTVSLLVVHPMTTEFIRAFGVVGVEGVGGSVCAAVNPTIAPMRMMFLMEFVILEGTFLGSDVVVSKLRSAVGPFIPHTLSLSSRHQYAGTAYSGAK
jgi:hypothetical protein